METGSAALSDTHDLHCPIPAGECAGVCSVSLLFLREGRGKHMWWLEAGVSMMLQCGWRARTQGERGRGRGRREGKIPPFEGHMATSKGEFLSRGKWKGTQSFQQRTVMTILQFGNHSYKELSRWTKGQSPHQLPSAPPRKHIFQLKNMSLLYNHSRKIRIHTYGSFPCAWHYSTWFLKSLNSC